jgi:hypothetical protein
MPLIHHPVLERELEVSEQAAEIWTTVPEVPWLLGPLPPSAKPTASLNVPEEGTPKPPSEED